MKPIRKIIDIGASSFPWVASNAVLGPSLTTSLGRNLNRVLPGMTYVSVDPNLRALKGTKNNLDEMNDALRKRGESAIVEAGAQIHQICARAPDLPFPDESFDCAILSDVLSAPEDPYTLRSVMGNQDSWVVPGVSPEEKGAIIEAAHRVLNPHGLLIVAIQQTPKFAEESIRKYLLSKPKEWLFEKQIGDLFTNGERGAAYTWCEYAFRKIPSTASPLTQVESLTEAQSEWIFERNTQNIWRKINEYFATNKRCSA